MKKMICIGIVSLFLLSSFITVLAVNIKTVLEGPETLGNAVDNEDLVWTTGGNAVWFWQNETFFDSNGYSDAAQSGAISSVGEISWISTTVTGPGIKILRFYWRITENTKCILGFFVDGGEVRRCGDDLKEGWWYYEEESIEPGYHELSWRYYIDQASIKGNGCGWLDVVRLRDLSYNTPPESPQIPYGWSDGEKTIGWAGTEYKVAVGLNYDPDGDEMYLMVDWGDGTNSGWLGPYPDRMSFLQGHKWTSPGTYDIKVKAKDDPNPFVDDGVESDWSEPLTVTIRGVRSSNKIFSMKFLERFTDLFPLLAQIILKIKNQKILRG